MDKKRVERMWAVVLVCGVLSVVFYLLHDITGALHYPGYRWMAQAVSDLTAVDAPSFPAASGMVTVHKILSCVCYACLCALLPEDGKGLRRGICLFAVMHGISAVGYSLFPLTTSGYDGSFQSFVHVYVLTTAVVLLSVLSLGIIAAGGFRTGNRSLAVLALAALAAMFFGAVGSQRMPREYFGLVERFSTYSASCFTGVLAVYGYRRLR